ncbi:hypothetical protein C0583_02300 [Candidatus Parcubacteria bacterium]|nr:MAG: hypothetical protein C0583_02300 [Candidatus Parcubacteria bacterium]
MNIFLKWIVQALAIMLSAYIIPGVSVGSFWIALWLALFLAFLNIVLKPILVILTLPITIVTLGLFIFVINSLIIVLASSVIQDFSVDSFLTAFLFSIVLSIISFLLHKLFSTK